MRDESGRKSKRCGNKYCNGKAKPQHLADVFHIPFAPILGGKDGHAARHAEQEEDEQEEDLVRQSQRGNRGLAQLTDHQYVDHVKAGGNQLLERDRYGDRQHGTNKFTVTKEGKRHGVWRANRGRKGYLSAKIPQVLEAISCKPAGFLFYSGAVSTNLSAPHEQCRAACPWLHHTGGRHIHRGYPAKSIAHRLKRAQK